jgi:hypothetical protein
MLALITLLVLLLVAAIAAAAWAWRSTPLRTRVLVSLDGEDIGLEGVLVRDRGRYLTLEQAESLRPNGVRKPIDGRVHVPRGRVTVMNELPPKLPDAIAAVDARTDRP